MNFEPGDSITFGKKWCKEHNSKHLTGKTIMMTPQWFEEDNGLYCFDSECPGFMEEGSDEPDSIYHLFGINFEWLSDCKIVKGTEEDKARYESIRQERFRMPNEQLIEDMRKALDDANLNELRYDEDAYDLYRMEDDWIVATVSVAADTVVGYVLANAPSWASELMTKNEILREQLQQTREELEHEKKVTELFDIRGERIEFLLTELEHVKAELAAFKGEDIHERD